MQRSRTLFMCVCSALQCVAVCRTLFPVIRDQNVASVVSVESHMRYSVLQCVAAWCRVLHSCSLLQCVQDVASTISVESCVCCSVLQCVAVCCSVLQCVAVC